jgi:hypothetical protein
MQMETMAIASVLAPFVHGFDEEAAHDLLDLVSDDVYDKYSHRVSAASAIACLFWEYQP